MTTETSAQGIVLRLAEHLEDLRQYRCRRCKDRWCSCHLKWVPLPVLDAVAVLLRHPRFNALYRDERKGVSGYVAEFTHPDSNSLVSKDIAAFDAEPELAVLLAAEKALLPQEGGKA